MNGHTPRPVGDGSGRPVEADRRWRAMLADMEELIERQRLVLDEGGPTDAHALVGLFFTPPDDLPPLPEALAERARGLLDATRALADRAREVSASSRPPPRAAPPSRQRVRPTFDRRA